MNEMTSICRGGEEHILSEASEVRDDSSGCGWLSCTIESGRLLSSSLLMDYVLILPGVAEIYSSLFQFRTDLNQSSVFAFSLLLLWLSVALLFPRTEQWHTSCAE